MKKEAYKKAIELWGEAHQMMMAQEECGELISAISQFTRGRKTVDDLSEEIADVEIMCEQMRIIFGDERVSFAKKNKINSLITRIKKATGKKS